MQRNKLKRHESDDTRRFRQLTRRIKAIEKQLKRIQRGGNTFKTRKHLPPKKYWTYDNDITNDRKLSRLSLDYNTIVKDMEKMSLNDTGPGRYVKEKEDFYDMRDIN